MPKIHDIIDEFKVRVVRDHISEGEILVAIVSWADCESATQAFTMPELLNNIGELVMFKQTEGCKDETEIDV